MRERERQRDRETERQRDRERERERQRERERERERVGVRGRWMTSVTISNSPHSVFSALLKAIKFNFEIFAQSNY